MYFEDFQVGEVHTSPTLEMTADLIVQFARVYDPQPFHLDRDAAGQSVFGGLVAGGFQTAALTWALALRTGMFDRCAVAGLGVDRLRWHAPVREGDVVRAVFWLLDGRPSNSRPGVAVSRFAYEIRNQRDELLLSLEMSQLLKMRPAGA
nr:MaoC/PaaZ C-terminal domain-containing protein [Ramlibacter aurantiacus]